MRSASAVFSAILICGCSSSEPVLVPLDAGVAPANDGAIPSDAAARVTDGEAPDLSVVADLNPLPSDMAATIDLTTAPDLDQPRDLMLAPDLAINPAGPWPLSDSTLYNAQNGLGGPILDAAADDAQNIWAITQDSLYVLKPGQSHFLRFTVADGLHIQPFVDAYGNPDVTWMTALAGGRANEVFIGYNGYVSAGDPFLDTDAQKRLGQADRVALGPNDKLTITRYLFPCDYDAGAGCWEDRTVRRMLFAHRGPAMGHLFIGFQHGVSHVFNDQVGDHVHVEVWFRNEAGIPTLMLGENYGLALDGNGDLWMAGGFGAGLFPFNPVPHFKWVDGHYKYAFTLYTDDHGLQTVKTYREWERGAGVTPDGNVWFAGLNYGLSSWNPNTANGDYARLKRWSAPGLPETGLTDLQADPDGTLWLATDGGQLVRFDPAKGVATVWPGINGVRRINLDATVTPRALYVSTDGGLVVIRGH